MQEHGWVPIGPDGGGVSKTSKSDISQAAPSKVITDSLDKIEDPEIYHYRELRAYPVYQAQPKRAG